MDAGEIILCRNEHNLCNVIFTTFKKKVTQQIATFKLRILQEQNERMRFKVIARALSLALYAIMRLRSSNL
jgi:hypothetical protein